MSPIQYIERPPRLQPELPQGEVEIPRPPTLEMRQSQLLLQVGLPLLMIVGYILVAAFGRGRSLLYLLPMGLSVIVSIGMSLYTRRRSRDAQADQQAAYLARLIELRQEMDTAHAAQYRFYLHNYPDPAESFRIAEAAHLAVIPEAELAAKQKHNVGSNNGTRLWERRPDDSDFGVLRLGIGARPSTVRYILKDHQAAENRMTRDARRLNADSSTVTGVPITIPLRSSGKQQEAARHALGVTGAEASAVRSFLSAVLVHFTTFHAPDEARVFILGLAESRGAWEWASQLPHCCGDQGNSLCFEDTHDRSAPKEHSQVAGFLRGLRAVLEERRMRLEDSSGPGNSTLPHLLVVIDLLLLLPEGSRLRNLEMDPAFSLLLHDGARLGASVLFLVPHNGLVPGGCQGVVELIADAQGQGTIFRYAEVGVNTARFSGQADLVQDAGRLSAFAGRLRPLQTRKTYGADLPRSVNFLDLLGVHSQDALRETIRANWKRSQAPEDADWPQAALGVLTGGDVRRLTFSADADGVHGLIAGSTGSGKSELLMTMILALAVQYDPSLVNFVLVDFKGGAAFEPFRNLPHCVDIVTNLHGNAVERMFAAIMSEIHRREAINVASGSKHIVHYRKNGLHLPPYGREMMLRGETYRTAPYPHLFIFIDEFAEMIAENPEYKAQLNSITRLGRALGISLILAAQRPTGVTDQMRANIKFRIALRVETREESGEVLRRPDAAYLPTGVPGRGYLQVGNENIELIQVAWSGAEFPAGEPAGKPRVIWHDRPARAQPARGENAPKVFETLVETMAGLAREYSLPQRKPWPDFLPPTITLETPIDTGYLTPEGINTLVGERSQREENPSASAAVPLNSAVSSWLAGQSRWPGVDWEGQAMRAIVGLVDHPYQAEQFPLVANLRRGHAAVFAAPGWGKTTFLRTLITSLAATHTPNELHLYILDFGGRQLNVFRDLPHLGALITPDEEERVVRLLRKLDNLLERRKALLSDAGADDLYRYNNNQSNPKHILPAVLVVIDNFAEFHEAYEPLLPLLTSIARESRAYGIHFVVSAELPNALGGKLYGLFTERFALKLTDPTEYLGIVGRGARAVEDIPGRGYVKVGRQALAFQAALPVGDQVRDVGQDETQKLAHLIMELSNAFHPATESIAPESINTLATRVLLNNLLAAAPPADGARARPFLGIEDRSLEPWCYDPRRDGIHLLVIGPPGSGKTTTLRSLALSLASGCPPEQLEMVLVDFQARFFDYGGRHSLSELPQVIAVISRPEELEAYLETLQSKAAALVQSRRPLFVLIDNYDAVLDESRALHTVLQALSQLARAWGTAGLTFVLAGSPDIARAPDDLRKQVTQPRLGLALESADLVSTLNGRVPRGLAAGEQPIGRGFVVRAGQTFMVQIATPYENDDHPEDSLDEWVERLQARYPGRKKGDAPNIDGNKAKPPEGLPDGSKDQPGKVLSLDKVDIEALKCQLLEKGMIASLLAMLSKEDIIRVAVEMQILELETEDANNGNQYHSS